jgi:U3 small nucleolar RNA-associated protein 21
MLKKLKSQPSASPVNSSKIFQPYRALGHITDDIPFSLQTRGTEHFLTVSIGKSFQIYDCSKLSLKFVSHTLSEEITSIVSSEDSTFVSSGNRIVKFTKAKKIAEFLGETSYFSLLPFGDHLLALSNDNNLCIWDMENLEELYGSFSFGDSFQPTVILHPSTYLNKILVGSNEGILQLWNINTHRLIHEFKPSFNSPIVCLTQSPVVDVVAIGLLDGLILIMNIRTSTIIMTLKQKGKVTGISFRTDGDNHIMASSNMNGEVCFWDLDEKRITFVNHSHSGYIPSIQFINGKPLLLTSGNNSIKMWIFDSLDGRPRLLKSRSGHSFPPSFVRYHGSDGRSIISAGRDHALRFFSTIRDEQNIELSQGSIESKAHKIGKTPEDLILPSVIMFSSSDAKQRDWDNLLTCHFESSSAKTWSVSRKAIGNHTLKSIDKSSIKSVAVSFCGNFGFIGCASGMIEMYNMQSGIHRKSYGGKFGHTRAITGVVLDSVNRNLASCSLDGTIKIWNFKSAECETTIDIGYPIDKMIYFPENDFLAISSDDLTLRIVDIRTYKVVREFTGHRNRITDFCFSPDGRWLVSSSLDSTIRTFDIPAGFCVDIFKVCNIAVSLTFSPTGDYLATAHVGSLGIHLWQNKAQFRNLNLGRVTDKHIFEAVTLPEAEYFEDDTSSNLIFKTVDQLASEMITLSLEPKSKWQNILNLETIKKRNKPKEPPKAPEKAPFFLPTQPGLLPTFTIEKKEDNEDSPKIRLDVSSRTEFVTKLENGEMESIKAHLLGLSPSALDLEIRSFVLDDDFRVLKLFLRSIIELVKLHTDFEIYQACQCAFFNIHGDIIIANRGSFEDILIELRIVVNESWERIEGLLQQSMCLLDFSRNE